MSSVCLGRPREHSHIGGKHPYPLPYGCCSPVSLGCGGGNGEESAQTGAEPESGESTVVGTWEVVEVVSGTDMGNTGVVYQFNKDGTMCFHMGPMQVEGTYTVVGNTLKISQGTANYSAC